MKFERLWTGNWENALRGMRHPLESYDKSDSTFDAMGNIVAFGENDMKLAQKLIAAGEPNDKFLRQIFVSIDITAPEYFWGQADTYKVGTVANSTSKMHKLATTPITIDCFETDDYDPELTIHGFEEFGDAPMKWYIEDNIKFLEYLRTRYLDTKDMRYWKELVRWLPESWLQTRTWTANYAVLRHIYPWRKNHKLSEWTSFCEFICTNVPYAKELICYHNGKEE